MLSLLPLSTEVLQSANAQKAVEMGLEPALVERTIQERLRRDGTGYSTLETLLQDCFNRDPDSDAENHGMCLIRGNTVNIAW